MPQSEEKKEKPPSPQTVQDKPPNWRSTAGKIYLARCHVCDKQVPMRYRSMGVCPFCGWREDG